MAYLDSAPSTDPGPDMDVETLHQLIFKAVFNRLDGLISDELMTGAVWLATEDAAKAISELPRKRDASHHHHEKHPAHSQDAEDDHGIGFVVHSGTKSSMTRHGGQQQ